KFSSVTCNKCTFTELFKGSSNSKLTDIFDFFTT
ncbi:MAG: zinc ribbon domain-containing protein, partial [SAR202 cluster bacterium]|nr:zinc ribbon domain-containing protein [SAR202 cluster bacterium]